MEKLKLTYDKANESKILTRKFQVQTNFKEKVEYQVELETSMDQTLSHFLLLKLDYIWQAITYFQRFPTLFFHLPPLSQGKEYSAK